ncbi:hypothetical protein [Flammeovirga sp. SJP92]|uniref:hypothetical protein n=1 Tax=Flammeovirga sp. SJP92 TaxID=1775430 RepID=UPI000795E164|nr:hypothetical protein [Flammeovirga sp. SJP92]KXX67804.1 hypothetical protein AVL50_25415 [Flammeovirga sp. SJP92]
MAIIVLTFLWISHLAIFFIKKNVLQQFYYRIALFCIFIFCLISVTLFFYSFSWKSDFLNIISVLLCFFIASHLPFIFTNKVLIFLAKFILGINICILLFLSTFGILGFNLIISELIRTNQIYTNLNGIYIKEYYRGDASTTGTGKMVFYKEYFLLEKKLFEIEILNQECEELKPSNIYISKESYIDLPLDRYKNLFSIDSNCDTYYLNTPF